MDSKIALFQRNEIRKTIHNDEWWFVITDIIVAAHGFGQPFRLSNVGMAGDGMRDTGSLPAGLL